MSVVRTIIIFERKVLADGDKNILAGSPVVGRQHTFMAMAILLLHKAGKCSRTVCSGRRGDWVFMNCSQSATPLSLVHAPHSCPCWLSESQIWSCHSSAKETYAVVFYHRTTNIFIEYLLCAEHCTYNKESKNSVFVFLELTEEPKSWESYMALPSLSPLHPVLHKHLWTPPPASGPLCSLLLCFPPVSLF